jgi:hypothetical protein
MESKQFISLNKTQQKDASSLSPSKDPSVKAQINEIEVPNIIRVFSTQMIVTCSRIS